MDDFATFSAPVRNDDFSQRKWAAQFVWGRKIVAEFTLVEPASLR